MQPQKQESADVFGKDMVKLDLGVHVDGYIADAAVTVDLSGNSDILKAAEEALAAAIDLARPGITTGEDRGCNRGQYSQLRLKSNNEPDRSRAFPI